jgi:hypothetical protein
MNPTAQPNRRLKTNQLINPVNPINKQIKQIAGWFGDLRMPAWQDLNGAAA